MIPLILIGLVVMFALLASIFAFSVRQNPPATATRTVRETAGKDGQGHHGAWLVRSLTHLDGLHLCNRHLRKLCLRWGIDHCWSWSHFSI